MKLIFRLEIEAKRIEFPCRVAIIRNKTHCQLASTNSLASRRDFWLAISGHFGPFRALWAFSRLDSQFWVALFWLIWLPLHLSSSLCVCVCVFSLLRTQIDEFLWSN